MPLNMKKDSLVNDVLSGRNTQELIEYIKRYGNIAEASTLRKRSLRKGGIKKGSEKAENVIFFGCMPPFTRPIELRSALNLLDELDIPYTYMDEEYCCGSPVEENAEGENNPTAVAASREFATLNMSRVKELGAKNIVYCCIWCAYMGKKYHDVSDISQKYLLDIVLENVIDKPLQVSPQTIGYYEGCHSRNRHFAPGIELDWKSYRNALDRIKGLKVIELNSKVCCAVRPQRVIAQARELGVDSIVCSCTNCYVRLSNISPAGLPVRE